MITAWATIYIVPIKPRKGLQMTQATMFDKVLAELKLAHLDAHHDHLLGGPNSDATGYSQITPTGNNNNEAYIHQVDSTTRLIITSVRGLVTVMVYHIYDDPQLYMDTASMDYISQVHTITTDHQCKTVCAQIKQHLADHIKLDHIPS